MYIYISIYLYIYIHILILIYEFWNTRMMQLQLLVEVLLVYIMVVIFHKKWYFHETASAAPDLELGRSGAMHLLMRNTTQSLLTPLPFHYSA